MRPLLPLLLLPLAPLSPLREEERHPNFLMIMTSQGGLIPAGINTATDAYRHAVFATNIHGTFCSLGAQLRQMLVQGRGGSIVNIDLATDGIWTAC